MVGSVTWPLGRAVPRSIQILAQMGLDDSSPNALTLCGLGCQVKVQVEFKVCCNDRKIDHVREPLMCLQYIDFFIHPSIHPDSTV
jgi:hypothetical protein